MVGLPQEKAALLNAAGDEVADGGGVELLPEGVGQVVFVDMQHLRQLVQGQVFLEMVVDIPPRQVTVLTGAPSRRGTAQGEVLPPPQAQQDDVQQALANLVAAGLAGADFLHHHPQAGGYRLLFRRQMQQRPAADIRQRLQALHPQHHVFHRTAVLTGLRVGGAGVDDHQVVDGHGKAVLPDLEDAVSAGDEKQLRAGVGVEGGVPLLAVVRPGHIPQPGAFPAAGGLLYHVLLGAHAPAPSAARL